MGVINVTPDSFSDGGAFIEPMVAIEQALRMLRDGARIIDIGGESSRPGATPVSADVQIRRILPVIEGIMEKRPDAVISIDTTCCVVAEAAISSGACVINDISGLTQDPDMPKLAHKTEAGVVIMHMQGSPSNMQQNPQYEDCVSEIYQWLNKRIQTLARVGIPAERIVIDPGIGFGKKLSHNLEILHRLAHFTSLGVPVLVGASRKRFIGMVGQVASPQDRLPGSIAALTSAVLAGASVLRVHDVQQSIQAARIAAAIRNPEQWQHV